MYLPEIPTDSTFWYSVGNYDDALLVGALDVSVWVPFDSSYITDNTCVWLSVNSNNECAMMFDKAFRNSSWYQVRHILSEIDEEDEVVIDKFGNAWFISTYGGVEKITVYGDCHPGDMVARFTLYGLDVHKVSPPSRK